MEHKVGETFQYEDATLQVVACDGSLCTGCYFHKNDYCTLVAEERDDAESCAKSNRKDRTSVFFKQINIDKNMEKELDLIKVLDGCPQDTEFYSDTFGVLRFRGIDTSIEYPLMFIDAHGNIRFFTSNGKFFISSSSNCKLSIFPSDTQRDWSKFERFWDKPKIERLDPKTLRPFDKVIMRDTKDEKWTCGFLSFIDNKGDYSLFMCYEYGYKYCIPYNNETKHLIGTRDEAPEYYKYWED